jgi:hypothetical protein
MVLATPQVLQKKILGVKKKKIQAIGPAKKKKKKELYLGPSPSNFLDPSMLQILRIIDARNS